ncbi:MAG: B-box zinc finger protein [Myxococcaceae bacterium]
MPDYQSPTGARCAQHDGRPASSICDRCGNFMCNECSQHRTVSTCPSCQLVSGGGGFPFSRDAWTFSGVWDYTFEAFKREWVMLSVAALIIVGASMVMSAVSQGMQGAVVRSGVAAAVGVSLTTSVVSSLIQGLLQMGLTRMALDVLQGGRADLGRLGSQVPKAGKYALQLLLLSVIFLVPLALYFGVLLQLSGAWPILRESGFTTPSDFEALFRHTQVIKVLGLGSLVVLGPLIYFGLPLTFATMELVHDDEVGAWEAVTRAYAIGGSNRLSILGFGFVYLVIVFVGVIACCVGVLPGMALGQLLLVALYLALRNGSGLKAPGARST